MTQNEAKKRREAGQLKVRYRAWQRRLRQSKAAHATVPGEFFPFLRAGAIGTSALRVYFYFLFRANRNGESWHAAESIADDLAMSGRNVQRGLQELERAGLIARIRFSPKHRAFSYLLPFGSYVPSVLQATGETVEGTDA